MKGLLELLIYRGGAAIGILLFTVMLPLFYEDDIAASTLLAILYLYLLAMFSKYGIDMLLLKDIPNETATEKKNHFSSAILFVICSSVAVSISFFTIDTLYIRSGTGGWVVLVLIPFTCLMVFSSYLRAINKKFLSAVTENGNTFLITSLLIPILLFNVNPLLILGVISWLFFVGFMVYFIKNSHLSFYSISIVKLHHIKKCGYPFAVLAIMSYLIIWYPALLLEDSSPELFVDYNLALRFVAPFTFIITTVDFFASTRVTNYIYLNEHETVSRLFYKLRAFFVSLGLLYVISTIWLTYWLSGYDAFKGEFFIYYCALIFSYYITSSLGPTGIFLNMYGQVNKVNKLTLLIGLVSAITITLYSASYGVANLVYYVCCIIFIKGVVQLLILKKEFRKYS